MSDPALNGLVSDKGGHRHLERHLLSMIHFIAKDLPLSYSDTTDGLECGRVHRPLICALEYRDVLVRFAMPIKALRPLPAPCPEKRCGKGRTVVFM